MINMRVSGNKKLMARLQRLSSVGLGQALQRGIGLATGLVQARAVKEAPIDTGYLRKGIDMRVGTLTGTVDPNGVMYAKHVHNGARGRKPNRFMDRAKEKTKALVRETINNQVALALKKA